MLVPDFGQQGSARRLHCRILPFFLLLLWQVDPPPPAALHCLSFRSLPERGHQNILEALGQCLIWVGRHAWRGMPPDRDRASLLETMMYLRRWPTPGRSIMK